MYWLRKPLVVTSLNHILIPAIYTPGATNLAADALSRGLLQTFRRLRPAANHQPTPWNWEPFVMRQRSAP